MTDVTDHINADELADLLLVLAENGFADQVGSWVSDAIENQPITGAQLLDVLGAESLQEDAIEAGMTVEDFAQGLAEYLPAATDAVTPQGELPDDAEFSQHMMAFHSA